MSVRPSAQDEIQRTAATENRQEVNPNDDEEEAAVQEATPEILKRMTAGVPENERAAAIILFGVVIT